MEKSNIKREAFNVLFFLFFIYFIFFLSIPFHSKLQDFAFAPSTWMVMDKSEGMMILNISRFFLFLLFIYFSLCLCLGLVIYIKNEMKKLGLSPGLLGIKFPLDLIFVDLIRI